MRFIYCSPTENESEQLQGIKEYLRNRGIFTGDCTTLLSDYAYNDTKYDAGIKYLLSNLHEGDVLYVWDLASLAKSLSNLYTNLILANNKGITVVQCLDGEVISKDIEEASAIIRGIGIASRIDFNAKQSSTKRGLEERKRLIEENGGFYSKSGKWVTKLGAPPGREISDKQIEASRRAHRLNRDTWRASSVGYNWVIEQLKAGVPRRTIVAEFNRRHETNPQDYSTRQGQALCEGTLSRWAKELEMDSSEDNGNNA